MDPLRKWSLYGKALSVWLRPGVANFMSTGHKPESLRKKSVFLPVFLLLVGCFLKMVYRIHSVFFHSPGKHLSVAISVASTLCK